MAKHRQVYEFVTKNTYDTFVAFIRRRLEPDMNESVKVESNILYKLNFDSVNIKSAYTLSKVNIEGKDPYTYLQRLLKEKEILVICDKNDNYSIVSELEN